MSSNSLRRFKQLRKPRNILHIPVGAQLVCLLSESRSFGKQRSIEAYIAFGAFTEEMARAIMWASWRSMHVDLILMPSHQSMHFLNGLLRGHILRLFGHLSSDYS